MAGLPNDPNRIDVSLELVGEGSLAAIQQLTEQLARTREFIADMGQTTAEGRSQAAGRAATRGTDPRTGFNRGVSDYASHAGGVPTIRDARGEAASTPQAAAEARALTHEQNLPAYRRAADYMRQGARDPQGGGYRRGIIPALDREIDLYRDREGEQARHRLSRGFSQDPQHPHLATPHQGDLDFAAMGGPRMPGGAGNAPGRASSGASAPVDYSRHDTRHVLSALQSNPAGWERGQEPFTLPQFGEFTVQDKLNMAADFFQRRTVRQYQRAREDRRTDITGQVQQSFNFSDEDMQRDDVQGIINGRLDRQQITAGLRSGRTAMAMRMAADNAAQAVTVARDVRRLVGYGGGVQQQGVAAGFERAGQWTIPGTDLGITNPADLIRGIFGGSNDGGSAVAEGIQQRINAQRLRLRGGIDGQQAQAIIQSVSGAGWTGEQGQNLAFDVIAPLVQQGQNPEQTTKLMDQAIRNGNTSVEEFLETMTDLGPAARAARMSLDEYQAALGEFAEVAQQFGATTGQGQRLGRSLSTSLGMAPQVASGLLFESPLVQGAAMAQTGLLPQQQGLLGANQSTGAIYAALDMAAQGTSGFREQGFTDPTTGHRVTGEDAQVAAMSQILGGQYTPDVIKRLRRNRRATEGGARASDRLDAYTEKAQATQRERDRVDITVRDRDWYSVSDQASRLWGGGGDPREVVPARFRRASADADRQLNRDWGRIRGDILSMAPEKGSDERSEFDKRIHKLDDLAPGKRGKEARKLIEERMRDLGDPGDDRPEVRVKFTGPAAKVFEQVMGDDGKAKRSSNSGGKAINDFATGQDATENDFRRMLRGVTGG